MSTGPRIVLGKRRGTRNRRKPTTERRSLAIRVQALAASARRLALIGSVGLIAIAAIGGAAVGWRALQGSHRLRLASIEYTGNVHASAPELEAYTGFEVGDAILELDLDAMALQLRRHPWIADVSVRRRLPDKLVIEVREHTPAILVSLGELYIANPDGLVFKRLAAADDVALPVITGLTREEVSKSPSEAEARVRDGIALATAVEREGGALGRLDELHWDGDLGWSIVTSPGGDDGAAVRAHLGRDPLPRVTLAVTALTRLSQLGQRPAVLWADGTANPNRVQVRLRPTPAPAKPTDATLIATARLKRG